MPAGSRSWQFRIEDILDSLQKIERYIAGMGYAEFIADEKTIDAVERNFEIIGEAATNVPEQVVERYPQVPWHRMRGLRNILAHEYFGVDVTIIWQTAQNDLPPLRPLLQQILNEN